MERIRCCNVREDKISGDLTVMEDGWSGDVLRKKAWLRWVGEGNGGKEMGIAGGEGTVRRPGWPGTPSEGERFGR